MTVPLSAIVAMIERSTIPQWLRDQVVERKDEIAKVLNDGGKITLNGPDGEFVELEYEK